MASIIGRVCLIKYLKHRKQKKPKKQLMRCYEARNDRLKELGMTYHQYLATIISLCDKCHEGIEVDGHRKRSLAEANKLLIIGLRQIDTGHSRLWIKKFRRKKPLPDMPWKSARRKKVKKR
jgi:hypothetical protein